MRIYVTAAFAMLATAALPAQEFRGTFSGSVTDQQGAAIAKARVVATEIETGNKSETFTETTGEYTIPFLKPGEYQITAEAPGFKKAVRKGMTLQTGEHPVIDLHLEVGEVTQSVMVSADVPLIETSNSSAGEVITNDEVEEMPLNGRTPLMLSRLAMGVISTAEPGPTRPFDNNNAAQFSMSGAPSNANELLLNGAPDGTWDKRMAYSPPQDAVTEVRVFGFESDAAYGHTGGGTVNVNTKGGTNSLHGSAYEFNQVSLLEANSFFANKQGIPRSAYRFNQFGFTSGGPVWVPKVFNGKNKVFWFFAYENLKDSDPANAPAEGGPTYITVPTAAERTGDFSALLKANKPGTDYTIYNPFSGVPSGSSRTGRTPFPNNIIPATLISPIAQKYLQLYPQPNLQGRIDGFQNYGVTSPDSDTYNNELARMDFNLSDKSKLSFDFRHNYRLQNKNNFFTNPATGDYLFRTNWGTSLDEVYTLSPSVVLDVRASWTRFIEANTAPSDGLDPTTLGFPAYLAANSQALGLPYLQFGTCSSYTSLTCVGMHSDSNTPYDIFQLFASVVKIHGNHSLKMGADIRDYRESTFAHGNSAGTFTFGTNWTKGPLDNSTASPFGQDIASFLLGLPTSGSFDLNTYSTQAAKYGAVFIQDDWRVKSNLTLNLGLRWERESPVAERFARTADGFDPTLVNSISAAAAKAYPLHPAPQVPASQFNTLGGLTFASPGNPAAYNTKSGIFSPRAGFAWVPRAFGSGTVFRGGFGVFVAPIALSNSLALNQEGFSQTTQLVATNTSNYLTPAGTLSNPFPNGILQPAGGGPGTFLGQQVKFFNPRVRNPYSLRWDFGIQRQLPKQFVLEVVYIGNHAVHSFITDKNLDYIPRQYLSTLPVRDSKVINLLSTSETNPFQGLLPNSTSLNGATVNLSQLVIPFPQFPQASGSSGGVDMQDSNAGESYFHSLNVRLQKRLTPSIVIINNFMYNKLIERVTYLNDSDPAPEKRVSSDSRPLRESFAMTWQVPVGQGRKLSPSSRVVNAIVGDWSLNGMLTLQSGPPLSWGNDDIYYGGPLHWNPHYPDGPTFDTTQFVTAPAQLNPTNSAFSLISGQANNPRKIQVGARLVW